MPNPIKPPAPLLYCNKTLFGHKLTSLQKVLENANKAIGKSTKFINKIKSRQIAYAEPNQDQRMQHQEKNTSNAERRSVN